MCQSFASPLVLRSGQTLGLEPESPIAGGKLAARFAADAPYDLWLEKTGTTMRVNVEPTCAVRLLIMPKSAFAIVQPFGHRRSRVSNSISVPEQIYNKVARTLVAFEYLWYQAWVQSIEQAKAGLQVRYICLRKAFFGGRYQRDQPCRRGPAIVWRGSLVEPSLLFHVEHLRPA